MPQRAPGKLVGLWRSGRIMPLISGTIIDGCLRVLAYPKLQLSPQEIEALIGPEVLPWFEVVDADAGREFDL
jgi:hypothetical protein